MPTQDVILEKLDEHKKQLSEQGVRLSKIEEAIVEIKISNTRLEGLQAEVSTLWEKYDHAFSQDGVVTQLAKFQASCPRYQIPRLWWAVGLLFVLLVGSVVKLITIS